MKISMNDPESENVDAVYLNGKRLAMCIEADDEAGYAIVKLPPPDPVKEDPNFLNKIKGILAEVDDPIEPEEWIEKRLTGDVEFVFRKNPGLDDDGLEK